jgi:transposase
MDQAAPPVFVGIDVAKHRLDVHLRPAGEGFTIDHDDGNVAALVERLVALAPALVVLEATGGLEARPAAALAAAGLPVAVVNPRQVRAFARAMGRLAKTDRLDAKAIACFAEAVRPPVRPLPDEATRHLQALVARRRQLLEMLTAERNRRQAADPALHGRIDAHLRWLEEALAEIEGAPSTCWSKRSRRVGCYRPCAAAATPVISAQSSNALVRAARYSAAVT